MTASVTVKRTAPTLPNKAPSTGGSQSVPPRPFGAPAPAPPDHRATALQHAVDIARNRSSVKAEEIVGMAEAFYQFLKK